ncbi:hypothetical protein [Lysinibacillus xylanilyticus]|uniref:hypothetical protein n=1 Tax=Lysinibacillus xylanilyticus TaxID=582475 RepID=UPI003D007BAD
MRYFLNFMALHQKLWITFVIAIVNSHRMPPRKLCSVRKRSDSNNVLSVRKRSDSNNVLSVRKRSDSNNKAPSRNGNQPHIMERSSGFFSLLPQFVVIVLILLQDD